MQGNITTVTPQGACTYDAAQYQPAEVALDSVVAERREVLERKPHRHRNAFAAFFWRLGQRIKNYFIYNPEGKRPRAWELDVLRGILLIFVTLDHCCTYGTRPELIPMHTEFGFWLYHVADLFSDFATRDAMQPFALWLLAFMSGINCAFTRSKFHRVFKFWIYCALFMGGYFILHIVWPDLISGKLIFNIIAVLTICFTVWWIFDLIHCPNWVRAYLGAALVVLGLTYFYKDYILENAYVQDKFLALMVYNTHGEELSPQNFEPLLPHLGFFLLGGVIGKYLYADRKTKCKRETPPKFLTPVLLIGKHSLMAYITFPFIILGIVRGICELVGLFVA